MYGEDFDTSSEESVGNRNVPSIQASTNLSFDNLTILVAIPLDPRIPRTSYNGVTATGLTTRDVSNTSVLNNPPRTKKWLPRDFTLKNNIVHSIEVTALTGDLDTTKFRIYHIPSIVVMSNYFVPVLIDNFMSGLSVPFDSAFYNFLNLIKSKPAHVHPNRVRYLMSLTILCRRIGVEIFELILRTFYSIIRMNNLTFLLRPRPSVVTLF